MTFLGRRASKKLIKDHFHKTASMTSGGGGGVWGVVFQIEVKKHQKNFACGAMVCSLRSVTAPLKIETAPNIFHQNSTVVGPSEPPSPVGAPLIVTLSTLFSENSPKTYTLGVHSQKIVNFFGHVFYECRQD